MRILEVADETFWLEPSVPGSGIVFSAYLIRGEEGILIEPGPATAIPSIMEAMRHLGIRDLSHIIPTHIHMDHAGGLGTAANLFPRAIVIVHPMASKHIINPSRLIQSTRSTYGDRFEALYGPILPVPKSQVRAPADGEIFPVDGRELQMIYAPGHAPHHIAISDCQTGGLFCGEALGMPTDTPLPAAAAPSFDLDASLQTMERALALDARILFYSHGGTYPNPQERIAQAKLSTISFGDMILESMRSGETPQEISRMIRERGSVHFPPDWEEEMVRVWLTGMLNGYTLYFTNKGLA